MFVDGDGWNKAIPRGSIFLSRGSAGKWQNTGIVLQDRPGENAVITVEANANDFGRKEGFEVSTMTRRRNGRDYIVFDAPGA